MVKAHEPTEENKEKLRKILKEKKLMDNKRSTEVLEKIWSEVSTIPRQKDSKIFHMKYSSPIRKITGKR